MRQQGFTKGRPRATINYKLLDDYLRAQCSGASIAGLMGIHPDTLYKAVKSKFKMTFSAYSQQKRAEGCDILRKSMYDQAIGGNVTMAIFLAKNYLQMTDKTELKADVNIGALTEAELDALALKLYQNEKGK